MQPNAIRVRRHDKNTRIETKTAIVIALVTIMKRNFSASVTRHVSFRMLSDRPERSASNSASGVSTILVNTPVRRAWLRRPEAIPRTAVFV
jgi:hypothetical protein